MDLAQIKRLRELTGVGITEAKNALVASDGDFDKALDEMRKKGLSRVDKKSEREARNGVVHSYVHSGRIGVLLEVNCETDFVARNEQFTELVHNAALQIAATNAQFVSISDVPAEDVQKEKSLVVAELEGKAKTDFMEQQVDGRMKKYYQDIVLMEQPFIKDPSQKFEEYFKGAAAILGENIVLKRFNKMILGELSN